MFAIVLCAALAIVSVGKAVPPRICPTLNLCYAIDESGSIDNAEFVMQTEALVSITEQFSQLAGGTVFSAVGFSNDASLISRPTSNVAAFTQILKDNQQMGGSTSSGSGLELCEQQIGNLADPRVILLFTDGVDSPTQTGVTAALGIRARGITIATVGVGNGVNEGVLRNEIASSPDLFTSVSDFSALQANIAAIVDALCRAAPVTPTPSPSASPSLTASPSASPSVSASPSASPSPSTSEAAVPPCAKVQCGNCGGILECYVNSGFPKLDNAVCAIISHRNKFCPITPPGWKANAWYAPEPNRKTLCDQSCGMLHKPHCYTGQSWPVCPAKLGGFGGYGKHPVHNGCRNKKLNVILRSFATYKVCVNGSHPVECINKKCKLGVCSCH